MSFDKTDFRAHLSRREFLSGVSKTGLILGAGFAFQGTEWLGTQALASVPANLVKTAPVARYWISANDSAGNCMACHKPDGKFQDKSFTHEENTVKCLLCAKECLIGDGERGKCKTRINTGGRLKTLVYGRPVSAHVDPIEKKPFYHYLPGSRTFSIATTGCPLTCGFCQNWELSQARPEDFKSDFVPPEAVVRASKKRKAPVIAFTYNEPTVFTEYFTDIARIGKGKGLRHVLISCGYMNPEPLDEMCDVLDAIKIDLKGYDRDFYRKVCGGELDPVLRSIRQVAKRGVHLEIVNLVVPTLNDSEKMLNDLAKWIVNEAGPDVPVHFTRFHPDYKMRNLPPTPVATLELAYEIAKQAGIRYPFVGNAPGHKGNNTYCPSCSKPVIKRTGFFITGFHVSEGRCEFCREPIAGVWK